MSLLQNSTLGKITQKCAKRRVLQKAHNKIKSWKGWMHTTLPCCTKAPEGIYSSFFQRDSRLIVDDNFDKEDITAFIEGKLGLSHFTHALKYSEDLDGDVTNLLTEIALINNWPDNPDLESLHALLEIIQQELLFKEPVSATSASNLHALVVFANLLISPGRSIHKNEARACDLLHQVLEEAPDFDYALASLAGLYLEGGQSIPRDPVKAHDLFLEAIQIRPDYPFALAHLGELFRLGDAEIEQDTQAAYHYLQRALDADPECVLALGSLGDLLRKGAPNLPRDPKRAYTLLTKAHELDPYRPFVLASLADLLVSGLDDVPFDPPKAYELLEAANRITQENPFALASLADMLTGNFDDIPKDPQRASELLEKAVALAPDYAYALASLGELYYDGIGDEPQNFNKAYTYFEQAYQLCPNSPFILNHLADLVRRGTDDHLPDLKRSCLLAGQSILIDNNQPFALWILGYGYKYMPEGFNLETAVGDAKAMQDLESESLSIGGYIAQKVKAPPIESDSDSRGCVDLASPTAVSRFNDHAKACGCFQRALELDPEHYSSLVELGLSLASGDDHVTKDETKAYELFKRALEIDPEDPYVLVQTAELLYQDTAFKDILLALEYAKKSIELNNGNAHPHALFAHILISEDMDDDYLLAYVHLEKALALDPDNFYALYYLIFILKEGCGAPIDLKRASELAEHALTLWPDDEDFLGFHSEIVGLMIDRTITKKGGFSRVTHFIRKVLHIEG